MSHKTKYLASPLTAAIAAALQPGGAALAQDQDTDRVLEEVIVTATLREVSLQDLPQSIQAFTGADIVRNQFIDFYDISNAIPSLNVAADQPGRNSVNFRGISTGTQEFYTDSQVAIYLDETPLTFISQQLWPAMVDVQRVEALPGPQGTLFGSSSQSGTLRIITNKPSHEGFSGEVYGSYYATSGGDGSYELNGHVNIPLVEDTLALRLVAYTRDEGGWIDNVYGETYVQPDPRFTSPGNNAAVVGNDQNTYKLTGGRAALLWDINEDWRTVLSFITEKGELDGFWGDDPYLGEELIQWFTDEYRDDEWWNTSLLIEGDLGFATLTSSTTYLDREIVYEWDNMLYEQWKDSFWGVYYGFVLYNSEYTYGTIFNDQVQDRLSQELRLTSNSESRFQWMIGAFYEDIDDMWYYGADNPDLMDTVMWYYANYWAYFYNYYGYDVEYPIAPTTVGYSNTLDRQQSQLAVFGEMSYEFNDQWMATVGARWFEFERDVYIQNQFPEGLPPWGTMDSDGAYSSTSKDNDVAFKFSTQYRFGDGSDEKMVYFLFSQGFRLGGENAPRAYNTGLVPREFKPDFLDNYEIGLKSEWMDNRLQLNATLFYMEWENYQFSEGGVNNLWWLRGTVNGGDVETKGLEVDLTWQATDSLRLEATAAHYEAEAASTYTFLSGNTITPGDRLPNSPENKFKISADYEFPTRVFGGDLWARVDYAWGDELYDSLTDAINRDPAGLIPDWSNTNVQLGLNLPDGWTLTAFVRNLTDERIVNNRYDYRYIADWFGVPNRRFVELVQRPRHYGISVRKRFN